MSEVLTLAPVYQERIWGGRRLGDGSKPVGEAWVVYEGNVIESGRFAGRTLAEASAELGAELLGGPVAERTGTRFPLLIKLLDAHDWLSVQVHPDDERARLLEGEGEFGKTEAWHFIETEPGAEIIFGLQEGVDRDAFREAVGAGRTLDVLSRAEVSLGDTCYIPAGTVHALGPGLFLYEVQQTSDITYRVYDWDRPASAGRQLHIPQAIECVEPGSGERSSLGSLTPGKPVELVRCPYFRLERLDLGDDPVHLDTRGQSFHALTAIAGDPVIEAGDGMLELATYGSAVVPAAAGAYRVEGAPGSSLLIASVPTPRI